MWEALWESAHYILEGELRPYVVLYSHLDFSHITLTIRLQ